MTTATNRLNTAILTMAQRGERTGCSDPIFIQVGTGAESYGWSRLTSLENVLSSPLLFCS
jgi:hypothetical protein